MKTKKKVAVAVIALSSSLALTACDPPIPPEILASLAEQSYTCIEGNGNVAAPESMQEVLLGWADYLGYSCIDPEPAMSLTPTLLSEPGSSIVISEYPSACKPSLTVPFAVDAAVLVYQSAEIGSLNVSAKSIAGILNGSINNWSQLADENPETELPNLPLKVRKIVDKAAFDSMKTFVGFSDQNLTTEIVQPTDTATLSDYADSLDGIWTSNLQEGEVALIPNSFAIQLGLYPANIFLGLDQDGFSLVASPDVSGIGTATTQWMLDESDSAITLTLDPKKEPTPPEGSEVAPPSYQAIYPLSVNLCSGANLERAIARFLLRLDNQGSLAVSNYFPLPEFVRIASLVKVSEGLPVPEMTPTE